MDQGYMMLGLAVIVILYAVVGLMAAVGTIHIFSKVFAPKSEQIFYAMFLIFIAALYLAFVAYFGARPAWRLESTAIMVFVALALLGARLPLVLVVGYSLHGLWDLLHELQAHGAVSAFDPGQLTAIPLTYGVFCLAFDFFVAAYCYKRRTQWIAAWKSASQPRTVT
ncbi:MAG: opsin family protein [Acidobacteriales bacterium]|nr:opsin family protein [Terriglobales bacterium]